MYCLSEVSPATIFFSAGSQNLLLSSKKPSWMWGPYLPKVLPLPYASCRRERHGWGHRRASLEKESRVSSASPPQLFLLNLPRLKQWISSISPFRSSSAWTAGSILMSGRLGGVFWLNREWFWHGWIELNWTPRIKSNHFISGTLSHRKPSWIFLLDSRE